ncbi:hypothetical protein IV203_029541 [Nitzschia inconspicua]|uniref:Uncharacterized protein n=1 Tax=Nitzschia inconspicua TaxID=303405 RepID=A0A9K3LUG2_9STRA|nr:hypothetical protein IV203_029541 [Nitzschia inconspicua]
MITSQDTLISPSAGTNDHTDSQLDVPSSITSLPLQSSSRENKEDHVDMRNGNSSGSDSREEDNGKRNTAATTPISMTFMSSQEHITNIVQRADDEVTIGSTASTTVPRGAAVTSSVTNKSCSTTTGTTTTVTHDNNIFLSKANKAAESTQSSPEIRKDGKKYSSVSFDDGNNENGDITATTVATTASQQQNTAGRMTSTLAADLGADPPSSSHHLEPEGVRTNPNNVSRRFDDAMLKQVMGQDGEEGEEEEKRTPKADLPTTIVEEEMGTIHQGGEEDELHEPKMATLAGEISYASSVGPSTITTTTDSPSDLNDSDIQDREETPKGTASASSASMPQYTPLLDVTSPSNNNDDQLSLHSATHPLQTFTAHVPESVMHAPLPAGLLAGPAPAHIHANLSSAVSNRYHHPAEFSNGLVAYPNGERGIPHMPALVLPQSNGVYHGIPATLAPTPSVGGKRRIHLRLVEDIAKPDNSLFSSFRTRSILRRSPVSASPIDEKEPSRMSSQWVDRGSLTVSWYEGTSTLELQEHVRNSVIRKLRLEGTTKLADFRILDETVDPPEEIVLCPYIPNGSKLLLRFTTKDAGGDATPMYPRLSDYGPPESPSAAPSPHPKLVDLGGLGLNANQLALLGARLKGLQMPSPDENDGSRRLKVADSGKPLPTIPHFKMDGTADRGLKTHSSEDDEDNSKEDSNLDVASLHPEDPVQKSLREITELLLAERKGNQRYVAPRQEKRQVIFVLANYFVVFLSMIAIAAEIQARAPAWQASMEGHFKNVQDCSKDKESLFECVENGDLAGLVASVLLWISRSAATKRIFLFGFETPKKLWTVVYESLVTAVCWGFSYIFIRRGMNPDTNRNVLQKYWKDAVYGSLAGFNAAFMKQVLKNLIPQEAIEDALQDRQLKILSWLPSFS